MKNVFFYLTAAMVTAVSVETAICQTTTSQKQMTMATPQSGDVMLKMGGSGDFTIDWGDGSEIETHKLQAYSGNYATGYTHSYTSATFRNITITGENVTYMECRMNQLTRLNVSKNTALTHLSCDHNQLTHLEIVNS